MVCMSAGDPDPDIGGPGILTAFIAQSSISLIIAACLILFAKEKQRRKRWVQTALTSPSDTLTVTGIAVCVGGFATHDSISLYHLRMLFDLIGLTTMANVAAIYCVLKYTKEYRKFRVFAAVICQAMAVAIAVILCVSVRSWDDNQVGKCYHWFVTDSKWDVSQTTTNPWKVNYSPINRDVAVVAAMAIVGVLCLAFAVFGGLSSQNYHPPHRRVGEEWHYFCWRLLKSRELWALLMVVWMYAYHVAFLLKIRSVNQFDLIGGKETEIRTLGQIIAIVMLLLVIIQIGMGFLDSSSDETCEYCGQRRQPPAREGRI